MATPKSIQPIIRLALCRAGFLAVEISFNYLIFFICPTLLVFTRNTSVLLLSKAVLLLQYRHTESYGRSTITLSISPQCHIRMKKCHF